MILPESYLFSIYITWKDELFRIFFSEYFTDKGKFGGNMGW